MKKIIGYFLVGTFLISQENTEVIEEKSSQSTDSQTETIQNKNNIEDADIKQIDSAPIEVETDSAPIEVETDSAPVEVETDSVPIEVEVEEVLKECENEDESSKISGLTYFDFTYSDDKGIFDVKRSYLNYSTKLSDISKFKMILDIGRDMSGLDSDERLSAYLKKAQITITPKESSSFYLGLIGMNMFDVQEKTWGYRYISKSAMDQYGFSSSADFGFGYKLKLKNFMLSTLLTNGEGYKKSGSDEFQKLSLQFLYGDSNLRSVQSGNAFNIGLALSFEPFKAEYLSDSDGGTLTDNADETGYSDLSSNIFEGMNSVVSLFGGFTMQTFMGGIEVNMLNSFDSNGYSIGVGDNGTLFGNDDTFTNVSTYGDIKTSSLISTYLSFGLTPKFNMFLRADIYDENTAADVENDSETCVLLGFHFPLYEHMDLAPVLKYNIIESEDDPSIDFALNFQFKF